MTTGQSNYSDGVNLLQYLCHSESGSVLSAYMEPVKNSSEELLQQIKQAWMLFSLLKMEMSSVLLLM